MNRSSTRKHKGRSAALLLLTAMIMCLSEALPAHDTPENTAIAALISKTDKSVYNKARACQGLAIFGTKKAVPHLAALLSHPQLANYARDALEAIQDPSATAALRDAVGRLKGPLLVGAINSLGVKRDADSLPALAKHLHGDDLEAAAAAAVALGRLGSLDAAVALKKYLLKTRETDAQRNRALAIDHALLNAAATLASEGKQEVAWHVFDALLKSTGTPEHIRRAALMGLMGLAAPEAAVAMMLDRIEKPDMAERAERALADVLGKVAPAGRSAWIDAMGKALDAASSIKKRRALLHVLGGMEDPNVMAVLAAASRDARPEIAEAALSGYLRFLENPGITPAAEAVKKYQSLAPHLKSAAAKAIFLKSLAKIPRTDALPLVQNFLDDRAVGKQAVDAALTLAEKVMGGDPALTREVLDEILLVSRDAATQKRVAAIKALLSKLDGCITTWSVAGPFTKSGAGYRQLFDIPFPPEKAGRKVALRHTLSAGTDMKRPWIVDLLKAFGGKQCVAYAGCAIHVKAAQTVRLEMGSDDGIKAWLNGKLVHQNNTARAALPYTDAVDISLNPGWNGLLLKITQNDSPWEFCARICRRDGRPVEGIRYEAFSGAATPPPGLDKIRH